MDEVDIFTDMIVPVNVRHVPRHSPSVHLADGPRSADQDAAHEGVIKR